MRTETKLSATERKEMSFMGNDYVDSHLMKLILARRETFLYKQSGVVTNCKWTTVIYKEFIAMRM